MDRQARLGHDQVRCRGSQPAGNRRRLPGTSRGRFSDRRRHRGANGSDAGRTPDERHRWGHFRAALEWQTHAIEAFDGRETAPAAADERLFLEADGRPMSFFEAVVGGRSVGAPRTLRVLELAHRRYGKLQWRALFRAGDPPGRRRFQDQSASSHVAESRRVSEEADPVARAYFMIATGSRTAWGRCCATPR